MNAMPRVGVIGGSIGGLTAALVLRDMGCDVDVFERSGTALEARGAGIGLHPMTTRYFDESSELDAAMIEIELPWLQFLSASGKRIHQERMNYRFSSWNTIYRGLIRCFDEHRYHLGCEVADFSQDDRGVTVSLTSGTTHTLDMLVCADGISSGARAKLLPRAEARYAGYVAWRATVLESELAPASFEALRDSITYCLLPSGHVLVYPIPSLDGALEPGRRLANLVWYHNYEEGDALDIDEDLVVLVVEPHRGQTGTPVRADDRHRHRDSPVEQLAVDSDRDRRGSRRSCDPRPRTVLPASRRRHV